MLKRPMKAMSKEITDKQLNDLQYPMLGSPKLDGIRALVVDGVVVSATLKPFKNLYIQRCIGNEKYNGLDGELVIGDPSDPNSFNNTTGAVRRESGEPQFKYYVFDTFENGDKSYHERWRLNKSMEVALLPHIEIVGQTSLNTPEDVIDFESRMVSLGYEGAMIRSPSGLYKQGRTTLREQNVFKRKPTADDEAVIVGFIEQMTNNNEQTTNELGRSTRSSHKENKVPAGTLGSFEVKSNKWEKTFHVGSGLTHAEKQEIWDNKEKYLGKVITYKYQEYGSLDAPRQPIYKGFRFKEDMTEF